MEDWIGVIGTLLGAVAGGGIGFLVSDRQYANQRALEREKRNLSHYEDIHKLLSTVSRQAGILNVQVIGQISYGRKINADELGGKVPTDELQMLVDFYAPSLKPEIDQIGEHWKKLSIAVAETVMADKRTKEEEKEAIVAASAAAQEVANVAKIAKEKLNGLVGEYT